MTETSLFHTSGGLIAPSLLAGLRKGESRDELALADGFAGPGIPALKPRELEAEIRLSLENLAARWDRYRDQLDEMDTSRVRELLLLRLLRELGFDPRHRRGLDAGAGKIADVYQGWDAPDAPPLVLVADDDLDRPKAKAVRGPHDELQAFLNASPDHRWGIVANSRRLRVVRDFHHRRTRGYVEFDLDAIFTAQSHADFLCLYRVCHATRFRRPDGGIELLERLHERSRDAGVAIGRRLQPQVKSALEIFANAVATPELIADLSDPVRARAFHRELLVLLYRLFFCLFAEQRGLLPPKGIYAESYSVTRLRDLGEAGTSAAEPRRADLWEGLKVTFRALSGEEAHLIGAFPFNGPLFDEGRTPTLAASRCENRHLLRAIRAMTSIELEGVRQHVNYAELGVEEIGSVYESLLDYQPTVINGRIELLDTSEERSDFGAYYTPRELVDLVLAKSLDPLIVERLESAGEDPADRERALLDIKVMDPACGSAAFLIGAIDRLAVALAEARRGGAPDDHDVRRARRDVLAHCIYAVDKDETAVELAKVALWIHCAVEDRPLTFLDHRIQHGDSLVGWPLLGPMPRSIPDDAFRPTSKDSKQSKAIRRRWRERNAKAHQLQLGEDLPPAPDPHIEPPPIDEGAEESPDDVRARAQAYAEYRASPEVCRLERAADLWAAAFLWRADAGDAPTSLEYWQAFDDKEIDQHEETERLAAELPFFHWSLRFPEIRERGGFDCVVGNPPWEQYKVNEREWFSPRAPDIAVMSGAARSQAITALTEENPRLAAAWERYQASIDRLAEFARHSGRYTPSGSEANTYLLFAELIADSLGEEATAGVLLKSQLALDQSAQPVFQRLVGDGRVAEVRDIVNGGPTGATPIFPNVAAVERFSVIAFTGAKSARDGFDAVLMNWNVEEATGRMARRFTPTVLKTLNPVTRSLTSFRRNEGLEVALEIHGRLETLDFQEGGINPWGIEYVSLFHSSGAAKKGLFHKREDLEAEGWELGWDKILRRGGELALPLYEGQLADRYDHRAKTYENYAGTSKYGRKPGLPRTTATQKADPSFEIEPRYWMFKSVVEARLEKRVGDRIMLGFRDIGAPWRNQRSAKGALLPRWPATHALPVLVIDREMALEFSAVFNAAVFDFLVRGHMPGAHVALTWMLSQIAAPTPGLDPRTAQNARKLSLTSYSICDEFGVEPHPWDSDERHRLDIETDALVAIEYGVDRQAYEVILDSFGLMRRMQEAEHGTYKLKEDCLSAFDRLSADPASQPRQEATVGPA